MRGMMAKGRGAEVWLHSYLTLALDGGEWSASRSSDFIVGKDIRYLPNRSLGIEPQSTPSIACHCAPI
jgi:hypothetical protein